VTFFHGNKKFLTFSSALMISLVSIFGAILSAKEERIKVKEKEVKIVRENLEKNNNETIKAAEYEVY